MMPMMVNHALNLIGRQRGLPDPAMLMIAVSAASRAPPRCPHPTARRVYPLIISTLYRSFAFLFVLSFLTVIEEIVMGYFRGESIADSLADVGGGTLWQVIATRVIMLLILIPWFAFCALGELVGDETLVRLFFEPRHRD